MGALKLTEEVKEEQQDQQEDFFLLNPHHWIHNVTFILIVGFAILSFVFGWIDG